MRESVPGDCQIVSRSVGESIGERHHLPLLKRGWYRCGLLAKTGGTASGLRKIIITKVRSLLAGQMEGVSILLRLRAVGIDNLILIHIIPHSQGPQIER